MRLRRSSNDSDPSGGFPRLTLILTILYKDLHPPFWQGLQLSGMLELEMAESLSNDWLKQRLDSNHRESPYSIPDKRCWIIALSGLVKPMHILGAYSIIAQILSDYKYSQTFL